MAFLNDNFASVGAHSTDTPTVWAYETTDTYSAVLTNGYFNDKQFELLVGDIILVNRDDETIALRVTFVSGSVRTQEVFGINTDASNLTEGNLDDARMPTGGVWVIEDDNIVMKDLGGNTLGVFNGIYIGSTANQIDLSKKIDDAPNGTSSSDLYIGNKKILVEA